MLEFKYDDDKYIHNENRDAIKNWLLNPPTKHHEMLLDMAGFEPDSGLLFGEAFDYCYYDDEEAMWNYCFKDLSLEDSEANIYTFQYLLYALAKWLTPTKRMKEFKVHLKKLKLDGDFAKAQIIVHNQTLFQIGVMKYEKSFDNVSEYYYFIHVKRQ